MPKYAVILTTTKSSVTFRSSRGFYNKEIKNLEKNNFEIIHINVHSRDSINQYKETPKGSIGLLWYRMHGAPDHMAAAVNFDISLDNVDEIFNELPDLMQDKGIIYLDSCQTGSLKNGCNNMQFAFAKLTLNKPEVQIVAPSKNSHIQHFSISDDGNFSFEMQASHYSTKNISIVLGKQTKAILQKAIESDIPLESIKDELINSLQMNANCPFIENYKAKFGCIFDFPEQLVDTINSDRDSKTTLERVKELVEIYQASTNYPPGFIIVAGNWKTATPLSSAIYNKFTDVALYLIEHGADLSYTLQGKTCLDYAKLRDEQQHNTGYDDLVINSRRKEENDNSKMYDSIAHYLNSKQKGSDIEALLKYTFLPQPKPTIERNEDLKANQLTF